MERTGKIAGTYRKYFGIHEKRGNTFLNRGNGFPLFLLDLMRVFIIKFYLSYPNSHDFLLMIVSH